MINTKLEKLYLIDSKPELCDKWRQVFSNCPEVEVLTGDYFQQSADAIVSPANSFGIMDGGLDLAIRNELGFQIETDIQEVILNKYHGEMPIGAAEIINTNNDKWSYMIAAPTMRIPEIARADFDNTIAYAEAGEKDKEEWDWYRYGMYVYYRPKLQPTVCEPNRGGYEAYMLGIKTSHKHYI